MMNSSDIVLDTYMLCLPILLVEFCSLFHFVVLSESSSGAVTTTAPATQQTAPTGND